MNLVLAPSILWELSRPSNIPSSYRHGSEHLWGEYTSVEHILCRSTAGCLYFVSKRMSHDPEYSPWRLLMRSLATHYSLIFTFLCLWICRIMVETFSTSPQGHIHIQDSHTQPRNSPLSPRSLMHVVTQYKPREINRFRNCILSLVCFPD